MKGPGYSRIGWHSDAQSGPNLDWWPSVAFTIHLDATSPQNGFLRVVPGSHLGGTDTMPLGFEKVPGRGGGVLRSRRRAVAPLRPVAQRGALRPTTATPRRGGWYGGTPPRRSTASRFRKRAAGTPRRSGHPHRRLFCFLRRTLRSFHGSAQTRSVSSTRWRWAPHSTARRSRSSEDGRRGGSRRSPLLDELDPVHASPSTLEVKRRLSSRLPPTSPGVPAHLERPALPLRLRLRTPPDDSRDQRPPLARRRHRLRARQREVAFRVARATASCSRPGTRSRSARASSSAS